MIVTLTGPMRRQQRQHPNEAEQIPITPSDLARNLTGPGCRQLASRGSGVQIPSAPPTNSVTRHSMVAEIDEYTLSTNQR
jgi:hypothetical protein